MSRWIAILLCAFAMFCAGAAWGTSDGYSRGHAGAVLELRASLIGMELDYMNQGRAAYLGGDPKRGAELYSRSYMVRELAERFGR